MSRAARVVCIACWNVDLTLRVPTLPAPGETVAGDHFSTGPGGKGSNVAVGAARLGARVQVIARLGDDEHGRQALPFWQAEGVGCEHVVTAPGEPNAIAAILVSDDGENQIAVFRGAGYRLGAAQVEAARPAFAQADVVAMPLELHDEAIDAALHMAREAGARTVLNPAPARALPRHWYPRIDVLTPNAIEARQLCGLSGDDPASLDELGSRLLALGVGSVVMTAGRDGAWLFEPGRAPCRIPAHAVDSVDTVGAGDAFNAGLCVALGEGRSLPEAARWASAVAALATTRAGAARSMPTRSDVESFTRTSVGPA